MLCHWIWSPQPLCTPTIHRAWSLFQSDIGVRLIIFEPSSLVQSQFKVRGKIEGRGIILCVSLPHLMKFPPQGVLISTQMYFGEEFPKHTCEWWVAPRYSGTYEHETAHKWGGRYLPMICSCINVSSNKFTVRAASDMLYDHSVLDSGVSASPPPHVSSAVLWQSRLILTL